MADEQQPAGPGLVQCEITKQWVPPDEIIEIQGHKVCAAGKEILLERLRSGEALPGELERPTVLRRFGCMFLDGLVGMLIPAYAVQALLFLWMPGAWARSNPGFFVEMIGAVVALQVVIPVLYFGTLHGLKGQSLGKMAGRIKVVKLDGTPIKLPRAYWRAVCYVGPGALRPVPYLLGLSFGAATIGASIITLVSGTYRLVNVIMALVDRDRQRALHDRLAGTRVIHVG